MQSEVTDQILLEAGEFENMQSMIVRLAGAGIGAAIVCGIQVPASAATSAERQYQAAKQAVASCAGEPNMTARRTCYDAVIRQLKEGNAYHWRFFRTDVRVPTIGGFVRLLRDPLKVILSGKGGGKKVGEAWSIINSSANSSGPLFVRRSKPTITIGCHPQVDRKGVFLHSITAPWTRKPRIQVAFIRSSGQSHRWQGSVVFKLPRKKSKLHRYFGIMLTRNGENQSFLRELRESRRLEITFAQSGGRRSKLVFEVGGIGEAILPIMQHCKWVGRNPNPPSKPDLSFSSLNRFARPLLRCSRIGDLEVRLHCYDIWVTAGRNHTVQKIGPWKRERTIKYDRPGLWLSLGAKPIEVKSSEGLPSASSAQILIFCTTSQTRILFLGIGVNRSGLKMRYGTDQSPLKRIHYEFDLEARIRDSVLAIKILKSLFGRKRLTVEFSNPGSGYRHGWRKMTFDLRDYARAMEPLRRHCGI